MKRHFMKGLTALCTGIMMLGASSSLFVSCDKYDDTQLKEEIGNLKTELTDLEKRIAALEADYQSQVDAMSAIAALQEAVKVLEKAVSDNANGDAANAEAIKKNAAEIAKLLEAIAKVSGDTGKSIEEIEKVLAELKAGDKTLADAIDALGLGVLDFKADEATGKIIITLSDGKKIEVVAKDNAVDVDAVKVKKDTDGKYYWAVNDEFLKDAKGNKIPVSAVVPQVKVDPETRKVSVSVDGGETWVETGIIDEEVAPALFSGVESKDGYIVFTLADGTVLKAALSTAASDVVFELDKVYVDYGQTRTVEVEMANVVKYVIVKPDGWLVSVEEGELSVTAPAEDNLHAEMSGLVQIFTVAADGRSAVYEMKVVAGLPTLTLAVRANGTFDVTASDEDVEYLYGVDIVERTLTEGALRALYKKHTEDMSTGIVGKGTLEGLSIAEILGTESVEKGKKYLVWAVILEGSENAYKAQPFESFKTALYERPDVKIEVTNVTATNADVKITASGTTGQLNYYVASIGQNWVLENESASEYESDLETTRLQGGTASDPLENNSFVGTLKELNYYTYAGYTYMVAVVPAELVQGMDTPLAEADREFLEWEVVKLKSYEVVAPDSEATTASVTFAPNEANDYTSQKVKITPAAGTKFFYKVMTEEAFVEGDYEDDWESLMRFAVGTSYTPNASAKTATLDQVPGQKYKIVVYAFDSNCVGKVDIYDLTYPEVPYTEDITVAAELVEVGLNEAKVKITVTGDNVAKLRYVVMTQSLFETSTLSGDEAKLEDYLALKKTGNGTAKDIAAASFASDGIYTITGLNVYNNMVFGVVAFDSANSSRMASLTIDTKAVFEQKFVSNPTDAQIPTITDAEYRASSSYSESGWNKMSAVEDVTTLNGKNGLWKLDMTWPEGFTVGTVWLSNENPGNLDMTGDALSDAAEIIINRNSATTPQNSVQYGVSQYKSLRYTPDNGETYGSKTIYLTYSDANGNIYPVIEVVPESFCKKNSMVETWTEGDRLYDWDFE